MPVSRRYLALVFVLALTGIIIEFTNLVGVGQLVGSTWHWIASLGPYALWIPMVVIFLLAEWPTIKHNLLKRREEKRDGVKKLRDLHDEATVLYCNWSDDQTIWESKFSSWYIRTTNTLETTFPERIGLFNAIPEESGGYKNLRGQIVFLSNNLKKIVRQESGH